MLAIAGPLCFFGFLTGLVLLAEGYIAIVRQIAGDAVSAAAENLDQVCARILAGEFKDGPAWIAQLRTALTVFAR